MWWRWCFQNILTRWFEGCRVVDDLLFGASSTLPLPVISMASASTELLVSHLEEHGHFLIPLLLYIIIPVSCLGFRISPAVPNSWCSRGWRWISDFPLFTSTGFASPRSVYALLGTKPRISCKLSKHYQLELHPQALASLLKYYLVVCSILHTLWLAPDGTGTWF